MTVSLKLIKVYKVYLDVDTTQLTKCVVFLMK